MMSGLATVQQSWWSLSKIKPILLTQAHIQKYYGVSDDLAASLAKKLTPVGLYERWDNPLFAREELEKELKSIGYKW